MTAPHKKFDFATVFDAALAHLDRFSRYAPPQEADDHRAARSGFGVG